MSAAAQPADSVPFTNESKASLEDKQEDARRWIAFGLVIAYVVLLGVNIAVPIALYVSSKPNGPLSVNDAKDLMLAMSGPVGGLAGILGFVVGYYFKSLDAKPPGGQPES